VLVIDDESHARDLLERFLVKEGFRVHTAPGAEEGIALARRARPAAITLDVLMPGMDGWAALRALKNDPDLRDIPVILITISSDRTMGYALGAAEFMTKPVDRERLRAALRRLRLADGPARALVIDDEPDARDLVRRLLESEGWEVDEAVDGAEALEKLRARAPRLILLDLMMPVMDGFQFVLETRGNPAWRAIPIVVLTAKELTEEDRRRLNGDVERIVRKGAFKREELLAELKELIAMHSGRGKA
jgi:CheY-like chemotaxis protein